jgi:hypothetical protein
MPGCCDFPPARAFSSNAVRAGAAVLYQIDRIRKTFADQFEQDGSKIVFRTNLKGAPVEVSAEERDFLLFQFNRHIVWLGVMTVLMTVVVIVGIGVVTFNLNIEFSQPLAFLAVFVILAPAMAAGFGRGTLLPGLLQAVLR